MKNNVTFFPGNHFGQKSGNGGGDDLEARVAKLESDVSHIRSDIAEIKGRQQAFMDRTEDNFKEMRQEFKEVRSEMKSDFRILFGALITVTLGLAGLMAKGFGWM